MDSCYKPPEVDNLAVGDSHFVDSHFADNGFVDNHSADSHVVGIGSEARFVDSLFGLAIDSRVVGIEAVDSRAVGSARVVDIPLEMHNSNLAHTQALPPSPTKQTIIFSYKYLPYVVKSKSI